jgi:hypothetical protein
MPARRAGRALWAVTAPRSDAAARPVAYVGGGGRHKQEGTMEHAPGKERGDGSHRGGGGGAA